MLASLGPYDWVDHPALNREPSSLVILPLPREPCLKRMGNHGSLFTIDSIAKKTNSQLYVNTYRNQELMSFATVVCDRQLIHFTSSHPSVTNWMHSSPSPVFLSSTRKAVRAKRQGANYPTSNLTASSFQTVRTHTIRWYPAAFHGISMTPST